VTSADLINRPRLLLASQSPARLKLLSAAGIDAEVMVSGVDESSVEATRADTLALVLARMKAEAVVNRLRSSERAGDRLLIIGCDSVLELNGQIMGKPADADDATRRWEQMRGREGVLHTGHCLIDLRTGSRAEASAATRVEFADVTDGEIAAYVASGEPLNVAGAFTIDGLGSPFVSEISGDHTNVMGLSMPLLRRLLAVHGVAITDLWRVSALA
jgi:nucleoside triphosphate pyrophosphatase